MRRVISVLSLAVLCLLCTACGGNERLDALEAQVSALEDALAQSEEQRISDAYDFQRQLEALTAVGVQVPPSERHSGFAAALRAGEVQSVLIIGDSISDGNGDGGTYIDQDERRELGGRLIIDTGDEAHYEKPQDQQGWVKHFRGYLLENTSVTVVHNAAINGKSAKWFNAHKELLFTEQDCYDAIFVMLGTNDRTACQTGEEFRAEYGELLAYVAARCEYLTVLVPIPAIYDPTDTVKNLNSAEIAENVRTLCGEAGYDFIDCYKDFPQMAADLGLPLGSLYWGGTHPNAVGYRTLWTAIAHEPEGTAQPEDFASVTCLGGNREDLSGDTAPGDVNGAGEALYPLGVSWYYTWNTFTPALPYGAFLETHREADGSAVQYARSNKYQPSEFSLVRRWENGGWTDWADND